MEKRKTDSRKVARIGAAGKRPKDVWTCGEIGTWADTRQVSLTWCDDEGLHVCQCSGTEDSEYFGEFVAIAPQSYFYKFRLYR